MTAVRKPQPMTIAEFVAWDDGNHELVEGFPRLMAPHSDIHGTIQANIARAVGNHLVARGGPCRPVTEGGIQPRIRGQYNYRKPDLVVTCTPTAAGRVLVPDPILIVEILSTNEDDTRDNIARYTSIESVREIVLFHTERRLAELWRRGPDGWPADADLLTGAVPLATIDLTLPMDEVYRWADVPAE